MMRWLAPGWATRRGGTMATALWVKRLREKLGREHLNHTPKGLTKLRALAALEVAGKVASSPILQADLAELAALIIREDS